MTPTRLSSVLADDLLLDRVGARLDCDDELGSLLLSVARHVDAPLTRPALRVRRGGRRGLVVLAVLGVAVSGATVAAALETAPRLPAPSGQPAHTRSLPGALQSLGLPFAGAGLGPGRLLGVMGPTGTATGPETAVAAGASATGLPTLLLMPVADSVEGAAGAEGVEGVQGVQGADRTDGAATADAPSAGDGDGRRSDPGVTSRSSVSPAADQQQSAPGANGSSRTSAAPGRNRTQGDEEADAVASSPSPSTPSATSTTPTSPPSGKAFAGTGNAGQAASHAATPGSTSTSPTTPAASAPVSTPPSTPPSTPTDGSTVATGGGNGGAGAAATSRPAALATSSGPTPTASPTAVPPGS